MNAALSLLWDALKKVPALVYALLTLMVAIGTFATTLAVLLFEAWVPDPPSPLAVLACTTDGLPDLEVVCSTRLSRNFHTGFIDFGDRSDPKTVDPEFWFASPETPREATLAKGIYHKRYMRAGDYRIELKLEGEVNNDSAVELVTVRESPVIEKGELPLTELNWVINENNPTRSLRYHVKQVLFGYNSSSENTWTIKSDQNWKFTKCEFEEITTSRNAVYNNEPLRNAVYNNEPIEIRQDGSEAVFSLSLSSKGSLFGGREAWVDGIVKCVQTNATDEEEKKGTKGQFKARRYGIFEIDNVNAKSVFESERIQSWGFKHKDQDKGSGDNPLDPIAIECHRVELTLVDPPMLEWEDRLSKVWLKVAPLRRDRNAR